MTERRLWSEGARTDRAIELLRICAAKTNASGDVVPRHRYSRSLRSVIYEAVWDIDPWSKGSCSLRREQRGDRWGMVCEIEGADDEWEQRGEVWSDEDIYDRSALAVCRALLNFSRDDGTPMTEEEVISMLEKCRADALARAAEFKTARDATP